MDEFLLHLAIIVCRLWILVVTLSFLTLVAEGQSNISRDLGMDTSLLQIKRLSHPLQSIRALG